MKSLNRKEGKERKEKKTSGNIKNKTKNKQLKANLENMMKAWHWAVTYILCLFSREQRKANKGKLLEVLLKAKKLDGEF